MYSSTSRIIGYDIYDSYLGNIAMSFQNGCLWSRLPRNLVESLNLQKKPKPKYPPETLKQPQMNLTGQAFKEPHLTVKLALLRAIGRVGPDNLQRYLPILSILWENCINLSGNFFFLQ